MLIDLLEYGIDKRVQGEFRQTDNKYRLLELKNKDSEYVIFLHRLIMKNYLKLPNHISFEGFSVHHLDGNVQNNHINNLLLMNEEDHYNLHMEEIAGKEPWDLIIKWRNIMERIRKGEYYLMSVYQ